MVELVILLLVAGLLARTWFVQGLIVPFIVPGGSMAQTLLGLHRDVACEDCGCRFTCGADARPVAARAVCPNCGCRQNHLESQPNVAGDRVLVDKSAFHLRPPRRWEIVAFRHPDQPSMCCVKRVVGLPGESVQIRHGDVYTKGKSQAAREIQRKSLPIQRAMALPVHDANCRPSSEPPLPPRWRSDDPHTQWGSAEGRFTHPAATSPESIDWLTYHHWRRLPGPAGGVVESPVMDVYGYNQTRPRRVEAISPVGDLLLSFRLVKLAGGGRLWVRASDGREEFYVRIDGSELCYQVFRNAQEGQPVAQGTLADRSEDLRVELSLFDQQLVLGFGGRTASECPYEPADGRPRPTSRPFAIGCEGPEVEIRDLRVFRDVYYTHTVGVDGRWGLDRPVQLAEDEYFVLGDNSPISEDSRTWPGGPGVPAKSLIGKPLVVHFPSRRIDWGSWHFQVPDPAKIRYIR